MSHTRKFAGLSGLLLFSWLILPKPANGDGITFRVTSPTEQTVIVGSSLTQLSFDGFITNDSAASITFALIVPSPDSPYVASVISPFPFPGTTLPAGGSTPAETLALVTFNLFDPSLPYPGVANITLEAETLQGEIIGSGNLTARVLSASIPEPPALMLLAISCVGLLVVRACCRGILQCARDTALGAGNSGEYTALKPTEENSAYAKIFVDHSRTIGGHRRPLCQRGFDLCHRHDHHAGRSEIQVRVL